jgi:hypothetical protein
MGFSSDLIPELVLDSPVLENSTGQPIRIYMGMGHFSISKENSWFQINK